MLLDDMKANAGRASAAYFPVAWLKSPGFALIASWRFAKWLHRRGGALRFLSIIVRRYFVSNHGCDISMSATIGRGVHIPHAFGIVIGAGAVVGDDVAIYQHVTLGRKEGDDAPCPVVGNGAKIYAGAVVLGGVRIGAGATVGANSVVMCDVPDGAVAVGAPARIITPAADVAFA